MQRLTSIYQVYTYNYVLSVVLILSTALYLTALQGKHLKASTPHFIDWLITEQTS